MHVDARLPGTTGIFCRGLLQIQVWGGSFFLLAVMGEPIMRDTGWGSQWVYGALSLSLMVLALIAPLSSRLVARYGGRTQLASSGAIVAVGLLVMAWSQTLPVFLFAWVVIGVGMAAGLYEALFSTLGALYAERAGKAISGIAYAGVLLLIVAPLYLCVLPRGGHLGNQRLPGKGVHYSEN